MSQLTFQKDVVSLWNNVDYDLPSNYLEKVKKHPYINFSTGIGKSFYIIGDHFQNKVVFISTGIKEVLGIELSDISDTGTEFLVNIVHPEDRPEMVHAMKLAWELIHRHHVNERESFIVNLYLRLLKSDGSSVKVLHQIFTLLTDNHGNILLNRMLFTDISHLNLGREVLCSVVDATTNKCWVVNAQENRLQSSFSFTRREKEILHLIKKGLSSKQIAEQLYLSFHTVRNHRKNMMRKTGATSTVSLITLTSPFI